MKGGENPVGAQPLGTGTTFFNMMDFVTPKSQQTPAPAPTPTPAAPTPTAPTPTAAAPSIMSYADWAAQNPMQMRPLRMRGHNMSSTNDRNNELRKRQSAYSNHQNQYMMEMIKQLGGLPADANMGSRLGGYWRGG